MHYFNTFLLWYIYIYNQNSSHSRSLSPSYGNWLQNFRNIPAHYIEKLLNSGDGPLNANGIFRYWSCRPDLRNSSISVSLSCLEYFSLAFASQSRVIASTAFIVVEIFDVMKNIERILAVCKIRKWPIDSGIKPGKCKRSRTRRRR